MLIPLVVALLIDFVQYVFGYLNTGVAYKRVVAPEASDDTIPYDETDTWYVAQQTCFKIKSWVTIANTVGVLIGLFSIL